MSGAFESTLLSPPRSTNKLFMESGFGVNAGFERYRNSEYPVSDGATSNRAAGIYGPFDAANNPREWIAGAASLTIAAILTVPTGSSTAIIFSVFDQSSGSQWLRPYSFYAEFDSTKFAIVAVGAGTTFANYKIFSSTLFKTTYGGQTGFLKLYFVQGSTNPVIYWNGVDVTSIMGFTVSSTSGTPPAWLDASMVPTYRLVGYNWPSGPAPIVTPILGTTSAADDAFYMATGKWPAWVVAGGSCASVTAGSFVVRGVYLITAIGTTDFTLIGAASNTVGLQFTATGIGTGTGTAQRAGALSLPSIQPINVIDDVSGIGTNCGLILGAATTATSNKKVWRIADLTKTSGNEQLLGGAVFVGTSQDYIKSWTIVNEGGTTTVSLGDVSGGAQYVSGLSVPTGTTVVTLLSNVPLTTNLWCNANTTASLNHIIEGYRTV